MARFTAIFDACVLYPAHLRDLLLTMAATDIFKARWTNHIHEEWIRALVKKGHDPAKLARTRRLMDAAVPDCLVTGYESLIEGLVLPDANDRHVLAAAIAISADVIVTSNLKHFPAADLAQFQIEAQHPDDFVIYQFDIDPPGYCRAIKGQRERLKIPPMAVDPFIGLFEASQMPQTAARLRYHKTLI
ncbi:MAG TPA: PIN domain-containing protein [Tepidisphaeraceae bacterium]|nr:PIN domain-containing protein [Tepidisphaeraceae bacterium]